jgi:hypothetical protein
MSLLIRSHVRPGLWLRRISVRCQSLAAWCRNTARARLKRLVTDLSLDKTMLQDVLRRKF